MFIKKLSKRLKATSCISNAHHKCIFTNKKEDTHTWKVMNRGMEQVQYQLSKRKFFCKSISINQLGQEFRCQWEDSVPQNQEGLAKTFCQIPKQPDNYYLHYLIQPKQPNWQVCETEQQQIRVHTTLCWWMPAIKCRIQYCAVWNLLQYSKAKTAIAVKQTCSKRFQMAVSLKIYKSSSTPEDHTPVKGENTRLAYIN